MNSSKVLKNQLTGDRGQQLTSQGSQGISYFLDIELGPLSESLERIIWKESLSRIWKVKWKSGDILLTLTD